MMTTNRRIPVLAGAAALVILVIWYFALWSPQAKSLRSAHKAHAAAEGQISQLRSQVGQLQGLVKEIPADNAKFAQLQTELPDNPQLDQALQLLHQAATQSGVVLASVGPSNPASSSSGSQSGGSAGSGTTSGSGASTVNLSMSVQGNTNQMKAFLSALANLQRTLVVNSVSMSGSTATISAQIFYAGQPTP